MTGTWTEAPPKKQSQKDRLLEMFYQHTTLSNYELRAMQPPMFQYPVRILELRRGGHNIVTTQDPTDRRRVFYTLKPKGDLFQ